MIYEDIVEAQRKRDVKEVTTTGAKTAGHRVKNLPKIEV